MEFLAAILLGLAGGLHCAGMCGPIALVVGRSVPYLLGRILTYAVLGVIAGAGASTIATAGYSQVVSIVAGSLMMILAAMQLLWHRSLFPQKFMVRITKPVRVRLQGLLQRRTGVAMLGIGAVNGLLPCGLVLSATFGAASTHTVLGGALFMLMFGLGTLPVMASIAYGATWIRNSITGNKRFILPALTLLVGAVVVVRGMGLGIPLLSPKPHTILHEKGCIGGGHLSHDYHHRTD